MVATPSWSQTHYKSYLIIKVNIFGPRGGHTTEVCGTTTHTVTKLKVS